MRIEVRAFDASWLDAAAGILAARHRRHRAASPGLDPAFEDPARARLEIARAWASGAASGAVALRAGAVVGYLVGTPRDAGIWGPNVWVESGGHAVTEPEVARELYRVAAARWMEEGSSRHYLLVPATDAALVDAWLRLGFGYQHVHALRESPEPSFAASLPVGLTVRRAERPDIPALAVLELVLPEHQARSPVFSGLPVPRLEAMRAELEDGFDDPRFATFVAEHEARVVGSAIACSLELSSTNTGLIRPERAGFLGHAAVLPEARGLGAGRALGASAIAWARDAGYPWVAADWRTANLEASRTWPGLGFEATFVRLYRSIP